MLTLAPHLPLRRISPAIRDDFVRECCSVGSGQRVRLDHLYAAWKEWCAREGRHIVTSRQTFGRDLAAAMPLARVRRGGDHQRFYEGIGLKGSEF